MKLSIVDCTNPETPEAWPRRKRFDCRLTAALLGCLLLLARPLGAAVPPPDKLLPDDTLVMLTAPDCSELGEIFRKTPQSQFWRDPAMKPFKDKLLTKCDEEIIKPLERDLDLKIANYTALLQGQLTFALTQNGWQGDDDQEPGMLLLLDVRDRAGLLKTNLAALRKKWVDAGKPVRTERIRDAEFTILPISSNDVPKSLRSLLPGSPPVQKPDQEESADRPPAKDELVIGMVDSLLIVGDAIKPVEKVVTRLTGGSVPSLAENAAYQANYATCFRDVPLYGWVNVKAFMDIWLRQMAKEKENSQASPPLDLKPEKVINALGFGGLQTLAFSFQEANEGALFQVFLGVPESARQGLFKILAGEAKECTPPPFVPADVIKFQRWRIDGKKAWATLEKTLSDISPQAASTLNFLLDSANTYAKDKDPGFDIRKNLIGNLGDDIITFEKAPHGDSAAKLASRPSLLLIGSPNADELAASLKSIFVFPAQQAASPPEEREFLGRKIYTMTLSSAFLRLGGGASTPALTKLQYAAGAGYVALSTDVSMVEDYLRSSQSQAKSLRETPGLTEAAQRVISPGSSLFGYQNQAESMRAVFELLRKTGHSSDGGPNPSAALLPGALPVPNLSKWADFSLLPSFDQISKYFGFTVYGGSAGVDGLNFKLFAPNPPALNR